MGNKARNLRELKVANLGLNIPPFQTNNETRWFLDGKSEVEKQWEAIKKYFYIKNLPGPDGILKISVRSSGEFSMPGILKTKLDIDLYDFQQFKLAYEIVLESYNSKIAQAYKRKMKLGEETEPTVIFQQMVYGISGIHFTADYSTKVLKSKTVAKRGSGEDLVNGKTSGEDILSEEVLGRVEKIGKDIENYFGYPQDIEFVYDDKEDKIYILQTRDVKFSKFDLIDVHYQLLQQKRISKEYAVEKIGNLSESSETYIVGGDIFDSAEGVVPGVGLGVLSFEALQKPYIYYTNSLMLDEDMDFTSCKGIISEVGNSLCHAAIIARNLGIPCIVGINKEHIVGNIDREVLIDGNSGCIIDPSSSYIIKKSDKFETFKKIKEWNHQ